MSKKRQPRPNDIKPRKATPTRINLEPLAVRRPQAALMLGISKNSVDKLIGLGLLEARKSDPMKNNSPLLILTSSIRAYIESLPRATLKLPKSLRNKQSRES
jgi:hypothetical protein